MKYDPEICELRSLDVLDEKKLRPRCTFLLTYLVEKNWSDISH